jgi:hypothetical protein
VAGTRNHRLASEILPGFFGGTKPIYRTRRYAAD